MSSLFDDLYEGLNEAIDYEQGKGSAKCTRLQILPVGSYSVDQIKKIRKKSGMTQSSFASFMGVSTKTVEAWESGKTHPTGPAKRLMDMLSTEDPEKFPFVGVKENSEIY